MARAEGSITKREWTKTNRKTGTTVKVVRWRARYLDPNGKTPTTQIEKRFKVRAEAVNWLADQLADVNRGEHVDHRDAKTPFKEVAEDWRKSLHGPRSSIEPKTRGGYESILDHHLLPRFGRMRVGQITPKVVEDYLDELTLNTKPRSQQGSSSRTIKPGTVRNVYAVLRAVMKEAVRKKLIPVNPCSADIRMPPRPAGERSRRLVLTAQEVAALADEITPHYRLLVLTAAFTGMRAGELAGLRRGRIDLDRQRITVAEALKEVTKKEGSIVFGETKNHAIRDVTIPAFLRDLLAEHLSHLPSDPAALVFTKPDGSILRHNDFYRYHFKPAVLRALPEKSGLRFHDLRHSTAAFLIASGIHARAIQEQLGHSSIQVTMDVYGHLLPSVDEAVAAALDATYVSALPRAAEVVALPS